ncbi:MAG: NUDIX domain-containing protein [Rickettsiales bacterium]|jgi:8-oxo-dGTP pyrophosphatase MutT (NUDIX family)|nr:NUDIX domain-containing protein [Rickettsiales bacterium]
MLKKERFKLMCAAYLIVKNGDKILFSLRQNTGFMDGYWSLIAGHLDGKESITAACIREAAEEAGMELNVKDVKPMCMMHRLSLVGEVEAQEYVDGFFMVEDYNKRLVNNEPNKCGKLEFFSIGDFPDNIIPFVRVGIENSLKGVHYCEYGWN